MISFINRKTGVQSTEEITIYECEDTPTPFNYNPILILGRGSFGEVFLVEKRDTHELFALKVLIKHKIISQNLIKYARTERRVLSYISHPFIVKLRSAFQSTHKLFLVLDYCPGGTLGQEIARHKKFKQAKVRIYAAEILLGLE